MENLEKKSLIQKLKQNSKSVFYTVLLLIISGILIAYASKRIDSLDTNKRAASGDELSYDWVNAVNEKFKNHEDRILALEGKTTPPPSGGTVVSCGTDSLNIVTSKPTKGPRTCNNGSLGVSEVLFDPTKNRYAWDCFSGGVKASCYTADAIIGDTIKGMLEFSDIFEFDITDPGKQCQNLLGKNDRLIMGAKEGTLHSSQWYDFQYYWVNSDYNGVENYNKKFVYYATQLTGYNYMFIANGGADKGGVGPGTTEKMYFRCFRYK